MHFASMVVSGFTAQACMQTQGQQVVNAYTPRVLYNSASLNMVTVCPQLPGKAAHMIDTPGTMARAIAG